MITVGLKGIRLRAKHGLHPEESVWGGNFVVNIKAQLAESKFELPLGISNTLDYSSLHAICLEVMEKPVDLIEEVAITIFDRIWQKHKQVKSLEVEIKKLHPPLSGKVDAAFVVIQKER